MKKLVLILGIMFIGLAGSASLFADSNSSLSGRDIADSGTPIRVQGTLSVEDGEWYLENGDGEFCLHLGPYGQDNTLGLEAGKNADVRGFAVGEDVAVTTIITDGKKLVYRLDDGRPVWAGQGQGRNRS